MSQQRGFAKRIFIRMIPKNDVNASYAQKRAEVQAEINSLESKIRINRREFHKTKAEKEVLKIEKALWKKKISGK